MQDEARRLDDLARRFMAGLPAAVEGMRADLEANFRAVLRSAASRYELGSRDEFEIQAKLLARSREQLAALEARLAALEQRLEALDPGGGTADRGGVASA